MEESALALPETALAVDDACIEGGVIVRAHKVGGACAPPREGRTSDAHMHMCTFLAGMLWITLTFSNFAVILIFFSDFFEGK